MGDIYGEKVWRIGVAYNYLYPPLIFIKPIIFPMKSIGYLIKTALNRRK